MVVAVVWVDDLLGGLRDITAENSDVSVFRRRPYGDGVLAGHQVCHFYRCTSVKGPTVGACGAFGVDLIVHRIGDGARLLAAAFIDEGVDARGQEGSGGYAGDVKVKVGLIAHGGHGGGAGVTGIMVGRRQGQVHGMV
ncbi:hypothetical protein D3C84_444000 [compost metagenome]